MVHTHTEFSLGIFGRTIAKKLGVPTVHSLHTLYEQYTHYITKNGPLDTTAKTFARKWSRFFCDTSDVVLSPIEKVKEVLREYGVKNRISVIPTGIEVEKFNPIKCNPDEIMNLRSEYGFTLSDRILLYVGRISKEKNLEEILYSLADYFPHHPEVKLLVVGDGPDKNNLQSLTNILGIEEKVLFAGAKPWHEIGMYYQLGDVFVSASQSETQGLTYIEALAAGLPLIAKEDRCLNNVLHDNLNGFSFTDRATFHCALNNALSDTSTMRDLSLAAIHSVSPFSAKAFAEKVALLYEEVLPQKNNFMQFKEELQCSQSICDHQQTA